MIDKKHARERNVNVIKLGQALTADKEDLIKKLKELLPSVFNSDGQLDTKALTDAVGIPNTTTNNQGYELTFAGKGLARVEADRPTDLELKTERTQSKNFGTTGNVVIRGDNLDALKILYQNYKKKIKMIYIDPPYNTKGDNFVYKNDFRQNDKELIEKLNLSEETIDFLQSVYGTRSHSGWLAFMYPRLKLARKLLREDGFIFITIDHYELNNLICIADELFGEENRLGIITILHNPKGRNLAKFFSENSEFMLVYSKNKSEASFRQIAITKRIQDTFDLEDQLGKYRLDPFMRVRKDSTREKKPDFFYPLFVSPDLSEISTKFKCGYCEVLPINNEEKEFSWKTKRETFEIRNAKKNFEAKRVDDKIIIFNKYREQEVLKNVWIEKKYQSEFYGTNIVKDLFGVNIFSYPKSLYAVMDTLKLTTESDDIVLDFFAGSGTTGHAVMKLNAEDGGNRKFILVQLDEKLKVGTTAHTFCKNNGLERTISSICIERLHRAGEKILQEMRDCKLLQDIGYRVFSLTPKPQIVQDQNIFKVEHPRKNINDTLLNMLVANRKPLDTQIECLEKELLYRANNEIYLLGNIELDKLNKYEELRINLDGWAEIDLTQFMNLIADSSYDLHVIY